MCIPRTHICIYIIQDRRRKKPVVELEDPEGGIAQEVPGDEEQDVELPECPDHQPSSFEKGKPQSIISLLISEIN
jgi:hypothetical protein